MMIGLAQRSVLCPVTIGRAAECEIRLADTSVSRRHAEIRATGDGWTVSDLGSTNGTKVNGAVVADRKLKDGDTVSVGDSHLKYESN